VSGWREETSGMTYLTALIGDAVFHF
jgi:hypothetical protein